MLKEIKSGVIFSVTSIFIFLVAWIWYAALSSLKVTSGNALTSDLWNDLVNHSVPSWTIDAFYLVSCPDNRKPADGTNGTPDLRWQFLRWLNDFWTGLRTDWNQNPETKALGEYQGDELKDHNHWNKWASTDWSWPYIALSTNWLWNYYTNSAWWTETRPKNVSVIFCVKE